MEVKVKLFATLCRDRPGVRAGVPFVVSVPEGGTIADLVAQLALPPEQVKVTFVNGLYQPLTYALQPGDEVGIFPPIAGGNRPTAP